MFLLEKDYVMLSLLTSLKSQFIDYSKFKKLLLDKHKKEDIAPGLDILWLPVWF